MNKDRDRWFTTKGDCLIFFINILSFLLALADWIK